MCIDCFVKLFVCFYRAPSQSNRPPNKCGDTYTSYTSVKFFKEQFGEN